MPHVCNVMEILHQVMSMIGHRADARLLWLRNVEETLSIINRKVDKISMEELIEKNKAKASKKSAKQEAMNRQMEEYAKKRTAGIKTATSYQNNTSSNDSEEEIKVNKNIKPGSIAGYANMLSGNKDKK